MLTTTVNIGMAEPDLDVVVVAEKYHGEKYGSYRAFEMKHDASRRYPASSCACHFDCSNNAHTNTSVLR